MRFLRVLVEGRREVAVGFDEDLTEGALDVSTSDGRVEPLTMESEELFCAIALLAE